MFGVVNEKLVILSFSALPVRGLGSNKSEKIIVYARRIILAQNANLDAVRACPMLARVREAAGHDGIAEHIAVNQGFRRGFLDAAALEIPHRIVHVAHIDFGDFPAVPFAPHRHQFGQRYRPFGLRFLFHGRSPFICLWFFQSLVVFTNISQQNTIFAVLPS